MFGQGKTRKTMRFLPTTSRKAVGPQLLLAFFGAGASVASVTDAIEDWDRVTQFCPAPKCALLSQFAMKQAAADPASAAPWHV